MRRININIRDDDISDLEVIALVKAVIQEGRISNSDTQYCYATTFKSGRVVVTDLTRVGNDTFHIYTEEKKNGFE